MTAKKTKLVKTPLNVAIQKAGVTNWLLLGVILTSKKKKDSFFSNSECNAIHVNCKMFV